MTDQPTDSDRRLAAELPITDNPDSRVPVFDCQIIVSKDAATGTVHGRVSRLPKIAAQGATERDVLRTIVGLFKAEMQKHIDQGSEVPWIDPPEKPAPGEAERWIPVHL